MKGAESMARLDGMASGKRKRKYEQELKISIARQVLEEHKNQEGDCAAHGDRTNRHP